MSFDLPQDPDGAGNSAPVSLPRQPRSRAFVGTLLIVGGLLLAFWVFAGFYTDLLWFRSVGFSSVYTTELWTRLVMFGFFGLLMASVVAASFVIAYRTRPVFRGLSAEQQGLDRYRVTIDPFRRSLTVVVCTVLGLLAGGSAAAEWQTFLQFRNSKPFFVKDAQFGVDVSFFAFRLPFWRFLVGFGFAVVVLALIAALISHYLYGGLRLQTPGEKTTAAARTQIAVLLGFFVALKAVSYWLDRYELVVKGSTAERISGATYTDVNALLPAKQILFSIAIICALLFFATIFTRNWLAPGIGFGLLLLSAIILGGIYPAFVQSVQVNPSEADKEAPYIKRNIDATLDAYKLTDVDVQVYDPVKLPERGALAGDKSTISNIRLIDPAVVSPTFQALQQSRGFYSFADTLDVDRYTLPGTTTPRDSVVAVRELDFAGLQPAQRNFTNDHTVFTHGYGLVAAYGDTSVLDGRPSFFAADIPPVGPLVIKQPRIYFGEKSPDYSIVGAPKGKDPVEFDFPSDAQGNGQSNTTYDGTGGVAMGSLFGRTIFAAKFGDTNLLLSDRINSDSKILWNREPRDRVQAVAPWLTIDGDTYPAVVNGRVVWILDGYTTTNGYPYSKRTTLGDVTADSLTTTSSALIAQPKEEVNYIRNSVKAVVDAYDGSVSLYEWDSADPVLKVWEGAFPGTVKGFDQISPELMLHLRYPQDLFKVQRDLFSRYHVTDPKAFYGRQDFWTIPNDPTKRSTAEAQPPYYLTLQMPDQSSPSFSLTTTFAPLGRDTLAAFMAVDAQPGDGYGKIRVLQLPRSSTVSGPGQVQNKFESDPEVSSALSLLRKGGSDVELGNLLSLPVGKGLLYVEPVYVRATQGVGGSSFPLLKKVLVQFGTGIGFADTLDEALNQVFNGSSGGIGPSTGPSTGPSPGPSTGPSTGPVTGTAALTKALADASQAIKDSDAALKLGDFAAYGAAQNRLKAAIAAALAASAAAPSPSPTATPSASPSPSATTQ